LIKKASSICVSSQNQKIIKNNNNNTNNKFVRVRSLRLIDDLEKDYWRLGMWRWYRWISIESRWFWVKWGYVLTNPLK